MLSSVLKAVNVEKVCACGIVCLKLLTEVRFKLVNSTCGHCRWPIICQFYWEVLEFEEQKPYTFQVCMNCHKLRHATVGSGYNHGPCYLCIATFSYGCDSLSFSLSFSMNDGIKKKRITIGSWQAQGQDVKLVSNALVLLLIILNTKIINSIQEIDLFRTLEETKS